MAVGGRSMPALEAASADARRPLPVGLAQRADPPLRGRVGADRQRPGRDRRHAQDLLAVFSKRAAAIEVALAVKIDEFRDRDGREPSPKERAALKREASADTRGHNPGSVSPIWRHGGARGGRGRLDRRALVEHVERAAAERSSTDSLTVAEVVEALSAQHSSWGRPDVMQAICDLHRPVSHMSGHRWAAAIEQPPTRSRTLRRPGPA